MKRKITKLENNLLDVGFKLDRKLYTGVNRDKVFGYVYVLSTVDGETCEHIDYEVTLDNKREKISYYCFSTRSSNNECYSKIRMEKLGSYMSWLETILKEIYDFSKEEAIDYERIELFDYEDMVIPTEHFEED